MFDYVLVLYHEELSPLYPWAYFPKDVRSFLIIIQINISFFTFKVELNIKPLFNKSIPSGVIPQFPRFNCSIDLFFTSILLRAWSDSLLRGTSFKDKFLITSFELSDFKKETIPLLVGSFPPMWRVVNGNVFDERRILSVYKKGMKSFLTKE